MLSPTDEFPHEPPTPLPPGWQENWYLLGWDERRSAGFSLHLGRILDEGRLAARVCVLAGGETALASIDAPLGADLKGPGLEVEIDPFRTWRVTVETADLALEVEAESLLPPVDWREALASLMASGTERDHYEVGGRFAGHLTTGGRSLSGEGLLIRDHTWGVRGYGALDEAWWTPMVFDGPDPAYVTGVSIRYGDRWIGTGIAADSTGTRVLPTHTVEVTDGVMGPAGYGAVTVRADSVAVTATTGAHVHVPYPEWAQGFWLNDAFCRADWDGRRGFAIVELAGIER